MNAIDRRPSGRPMQLFNGFSLDDWHHAGRGRFRIEDGALVTEGGMGLLWYAGRQFGDFELRLDWRVTKRSDNSGVFVRFPSPLDDSGRADPRIAIREGYEIQIDDLGAPDGEPIHQTGAIYNARGPSKVASKPPGEWNTFVIRAQGQKYDVLLNGESVIADFEGDRSLQGYMGLQNHSAKSQVFFRNILLTPL